MYTAPLVLASPAPMICQAASNPLLKIAQHFQRDVISWLDEVQQNSFLKSTILDFLHSGDIKLRKTNPASEFSLLRFSLLRLLDKDNNSVFRIIGHQMIGLPGTYGHVKIALPLQFDQENNEIVCRTFLPMALKIIRRVDIHDEETPLPSISAQSVFRRIYPSTYAHNTSVTQSKKSRYSNPDDPAIEKELQSDKKICQHAFI